MMAHNNEQKYHPALIENWLDAYLDGELDDDRRTAFEAHMEGCPQCGAILAQRRALSSLLKEAPPATGLKPEGQFLAEVKQKVRVEQSGVHAHNALRLAWQFAPLGLVLAWFFVQSVSLVSSALAFFPGLERIVGANMFTGFPWAGFLERGLVALGLDWLSLTSLYNPLVWNGITNLVLLVAIGLLYLAWLAIWWVRSQGNRKVLQVKEITR